MQKTESTYRTSLEQKDRDFNQASQRYSSDLQQRDQKHSDQCQQLFKENGQQNDRFSDESKKRDTDYNATISTLTEKWHKELKDLDTQRLKDHDQMKSELSQQASTHLQAKAQWQATTQANEKRYTDNKSKDDATHHALHTEV